MAKNKKKQAQEEKSGPALWVEKIKIFLEEAKGELEKVTWPTQKQVLMTTIAVVVLVGVLSVFLSLVDFGLAKIVQWILS